MSNENTEIAITRKRKPVKRQQLEITTVDDLSSVLMELKNQESSDSALAYAVNAQLQVLGVINSPGLSSSAYDLMFDSLKTAIQKAETQQEKEEYQRSAAIMTNSMVFFLHAKLYWENNKWSDQGIALLKTACNLVADSSATLISHGANIAISRNLGEEMFADMTANKNDFFDKLIDWFGKGKRVEQYRGEFHVFLLRLFDKLEKYRDIYGYQALLSELVLRYKDEVADFIAKNKKNKSSGLRRLNPDSPHLRKSFSSWLIKWLLKITLCVVSGMYIIGVIGWCAGDKWLELFGRTFLFYPFFSIHFFFLGLAWYFRILIGGGLILLSAMANNKIKDMYYYKLRYIAEDYFTEIANLY